MGQGGGSSEKLRSSSDNLSVLVRTLWIRSKVLKQNRSLSELTKPLRNVLLVGALVPVAVLLTGTEAAEPPKVQVADGIALPRRPVAGAIAEAMRLRNDVPNQTLAPSPWSSCNLCLGKSTSSQPAQSMIMKPLAASPLNGTCLR